MNDKVKEQTTVSSQYLYNGNKVQAYSGPDLVTSNRLKTGTYEVQFNPDSGYYLTKIPDMLVPPVIYGETGEFSKDVITSYLDRGCNTGVLLEGEQGSGKTMLAKILSAAMRELDMPTIVINKAYYGPGFNNFMTAIDTPGLVFFDEFEKTYSRIEEKEGVLTFFDGVFDSNKLIVCTINDKSRMSTHMLNRPSRLYYMISYNRLSLEVITEYCEKNLKDKTQVDAVKRISVMYGGFNFDMLKALVEELNRFGRPIKQTLKYLNIRPSYTKFDTGVRYVMIAMQENGSDIKYTTVINAKPPTDDDRYESSIYLSSYKSEDIRVILSQLSDAVIPDKDTFIKLMSESAEGISSGRGFGKSDTTYARVEEEHLDSYNTETGVLTYKNPIGAIFRYYPVSLEDTTDFASMIAATKNKADAPSPNRIPSLKSF